MIYYTIEQAVALLPNKPTGSWLIKQMIDPDTKTDGSRESFITPSVNFTDRVLLRSEITGYSNPEYFDGWFEIEGMHEPGRVRDGEICFTEPSRYLCLVRDCVRYWPCQPLKIPFKDLRVSKQELELFAELTGRHIGTASDVNRIIASQAGKLLKSRQTADIDAKIESLCEHIKSTAIEHKKGQNPGMVINHMRFVAEAGLDSGGEKERVLKAVRLFIEGHDGLGFHGFKYCRKRLKKDSPYFLAE